MPIFGCLKKAKRGNGTISRTSAGVHISPLWNRQGTLAWPNEDDLQSAFSFGNIVSSELRRQWWFGPEAMRAALLSLVEKVHEANRQLWIRLDDARLCKSSGPQARISTDYLKSDWFPYVNSLLDSVASKAFGVQVLNEVFHVEHIIQTTDGDLTPKGLVDFLTRTYVSIKTKYPKLAVLNPGFTTFVEPRYWSYLLKCLQAGLCDATDALNLHLYVDGKLQGSEWRRIEELGKKLAGFPVVITELNHRSSKASAEAKFKACKEAIEICNAYLNVRTWVFFCWTGVGDAELRQWMIHGTPLEEKLRGLIK